TISKDRTQVAIYKDIAIVGKFKEKIGRNAGQGAAYIYERNHGGANNWGQVKELTASDGAAYDEFGSTVAIYADLAIVSAKGSNKTDKDGKFGRGGAYIFEQNKGGDNKWGEVRKLTSPVDIHVDSFGTSVAIYGDTAIVGTEAKNAAYIFSPKTTGR
ncbi:MAG: hypothetical protein J2P21_25945, partial [Chloracidobacterium sp.]|nr:hypothetical protein [Chloracidobacterium sp.]